MMNTTPHPHRARMIRHAGAVSSILLMMAWSVGAASAQSPAPQATGPVTAATENQANALAEAEVRRVDAANGRLQLRHGPIANLDMPPMTMVFRVKSPALLEGLKEGDRILFAAEKIDGAYTVTRVEKRP